jgi:phage major head subunit gpT-like protein
MELRSSLLTAYFQSLDTLFNKAFQEASPQWNQIAMQTNSTSEVSVYAWMEQLKGFREWVGPRVFESIKSNGYVLTNNAYEDSVLILRNKLEDDSYGIYTNMVQQLAYAGAYHPDVQIFGLLENGFTNTCWDGKAFFAADHVIRTEKDGVDYTFTNASTLVLNETSLTNARAALRKACQGGDTPFMGDLQFKLVVGPDLEDRAKKLLEADTNEFGAYNTVKGIASLLVNAQITGTKWFLLVVNNPIKPLIFQLRRSMETFVPQASDESVRETGYYKFMADYRGAFGYGLPQLAYGSTGAASEE